MSAHQTPGPWGPAHHRGYSGSYWILERKNSAWMGGWQKLYGKGGDLRKWRSESAAQQAADEENEKATGSAAE